MPGHEAKTNFQKGMDERAEALLKYMHENSPRPVAVFISIIYGEGACHCALGIPKDIAAGVAMNLSNFMETLPKREEEA